MEKFIGLALYGVLKDAKGNIPDVDSDPAWREFLSDISVLSLQSAALSDMLRSLLRARVEFSHLIDNGGLSPDALPHASKAVSLIDIEVRIVELALEHRDIFKPLTPPSSPVHLAPGVTQTDIGEIIRPMCSLHHFRDANGNVMPLDRVTEQFSWFLNMKMYGVRNKGYKASTREKGPTAFLDKLRDELIKKSEK